MEYKETVNMANVDGYYFLLDLKMLAKHEEHKPFLYRRGIGWTFDTILDEYIFLGDGDCVRIAKETAERLAKKYDAGEVLSLEI